ncbi:MAG: ROK family transcriptional regulator [bacterium]
MLSKLSGKPTLIRDINRSMVLETIEKKGPISRADISRLTKISSPTISLAVEYFLKKGIVKEKGIGESSGGRKPTLIELNSNGGFVIGVDLGGTNIKLVLVNLCGKTVKKVKGTAINSSSKNKILDRLKEIIHSVIDESDTDRDLILGIGIGISGVSDESGRVSFAPALGWEDMPVKDLLREEFKIPVAVENDVNAAALGEKLFGVGKTVENFVFVAIGTGVGAGIIINGKLYKGFANAAGEVGYLVMGEKYLKDYRKGFGCLESLISGPAIAAKAANQMRSYNSGSTGISFRQDKNITAKDVFEAAKRKDKVALKIVEEVNKYLAIGLGNVSALLNPEMIVLGGGISRQEDILLKPLREMIAKITPIPPKIVISWLGDDAGVIGAAALAWDLVRHTSLIS